MSISAPRADILESLDIERYFARQFAFGELFLHATAESRLIGLADRIGFHVEIDAEFIEDALAERAPDAFDRREGDLDAFLAGEDDTGDTKHDEKVLTEKESRRELSE